MKKKDLKSRKKAIKALKSEMRGDSMSSLPEKLGGKMAVKVMADSPEGLMEGLEKAEEVLEGDDNIKDMLSEAFSKRNKKSKKEEE